MLANTLPCAWLPSSIFSGQPALGKHDVVLCEGDGLVIPQAERGDKPCPPRKAGRRLRRRSGPKGPFSQEAETRRGLTGHVSFVPDGQPAARPSANVLHASSAPRPHPDVPEPPCVLHAGASTWPSPEGRTLRETRLSFRGLAMSFVPGALESRTAFAAFLRRTLHLSRRGLPPPASVLLPLPVPHPGIFRHVPRAGLQFRQKIACRRLLHAAVMAINFVYHDCVPVPMDCLARQPSPAQSRCLQYLRGKDLR